MKKGQVLEGVVERVDFPNKGIVRIGEETVVVKNCLPGQKVKFGINKVRKGKAEGRLLEVLEKSPQETGRPCSLFGVCGGCTYLSLPYEEQLCIKEAQVKRLLDSVLDRQQESWRWEGIKGSPKAYEYRNKMEFTFGDAQKGGPLSLGMHKRGSFYDVVTVEDCKIVDEDYRIILKTVREYFAEKEVSFFHRLSHKGYLRHLLLRKASGTGEILAALVTTSQTPWESGEEQMQRVAAQELQELTEGFRNALLALEKEGKILGKFAGILHITNDSMADTVQSDRTDILYGQDYFYEELLGLKFKISLFSFFQTNSYGAEVLYRTVRDYVGDLGEGDKTIFDLYSGTGTIAQLMAPVAAQVIGVEIVEEAVEAARQNAKDNGLSNCSFLAGDVLKVLAELTAKPDMIILDPPRDGIHPKALPRIIDYGVERIVYISCKATSLARDLEVFLERGYVVEKAVAVDQFPWTANVETVVLLSKGEIDSKKVRVEFSLEDMDMSGFQKGTTYQKLKAYVKEQTGLSVSSLYISQIKRKCGLDVGQNYNLSKKENAKAPQCPLKKEEAIRAALKHFGIL
ncbi:MAG: 23S rRNA (uracil(1939)-C(5))-methyltransferase RlmD [Bacteroidales bacterium]|nr:23S rRNA (uracil(1939)-C(5))-methyltransferase RlmD [Lachnoclostridium sp.]MCM1383665.1 23S rRNA (uracil(1939)-C(5))-methyltransferase RlmD [Lachnoclostridium sp.]MCM1466295.1 23S rRNA (uracil(1939)-C(5))-methyltransferase RlmD [Bacteroidales bacterium]